MGWLEAIPDLSLVSSFMSFIEWDEALHFYVEFL